MSTYKHTCMLLLLPLLVRAAEAATRRLQVEFVDTLWVDRLRNATLCLAANATLGGSADCASVAAFAQNGIFMAAMQLNVANGTVNIYTTDAAAAMGAYLRAQGFFTLEQSYVSQVSDVDRPLALMLGFVVAITLLLVATAVGMYRCAQVPLRPRK